HVSAVMGTPHYASPEQFQTGRHIDGRTDIYSLGVMLYQMLTGSLPFNAPSAQELIRLQQTVPPPLIRELRAEVPVAIESLINSMLAKEPGQRPQSASRVADLFEQSLETTVNSV